MKTLRLLIAAALMLAVLPAVASASNSQESMFQDDPLLVGDTTDAKMKATLDELKQIGVDRVRVSLFWSVVAPENTKVDKPNFDSSDPNDYPAGSWDRYDRLLVAAHERGIAVNLNVTSPAPRWGSDGASPRPEIQDTFQPDPVEFGRFVAAAAKRYSGDVVGLPRVDYWSIFNEPNQAGWLTPQWKPDPRAPKKFIEASPELYRDLLRTSYQALQDTGHGADTILIGDTAPKGLKNRKGFAISIDALKFVRSLYCVDKHRQRYKGSSASVRGCPATAAQFVADNPALFKATGFAHHPYELYLAPNRKAAGKDWVTIANLSTLTNELKALYQRYGQKSQTKRGTPLYLTEYGYQTPPDPLGIPLSKQATYLDQAEQIAYRNPLVRSMSQFLLVDQPPTPGIQNPRLAYRTFQSGLKKVSGKKKPAYRAYVTPLFLSKTRVRRGQSSAVFGLLRSADPTTSVKVQIQFRGKHSKKWKTRKTVSTKAPRHYLRTKLVIRSAGSVRLRWKNGDQQVTSRSVKVSIRG
jgi:Cellulase (glycosyl hydrolase family 5)